MKVKLRYTSIAGLISCLLSLTVPCSVQVLDVLCSLCAGNGVAVRSNQNLICDNLLPGRDLLLQTKLVEHVFRSDHMTLRLWVYWDRCAVAGGC